VIRVTKEKDNSSHELGFVGLRVITINVIGVKILSDYMVSQWIKYWKLWMKVVFVFS